MFSGSVQAHRIDFRTIARRLDDCTPQPAFHLGKTGNPPVSVPEQFTSIENVLDVRIVAGVYIRMPYSLFGGGFA